MKRPAAILLAWTLTGMPLGAAEVQSLPQRGITSSRQFIIYCDDPGARMRSGNLAENVKSFWLRRAGLRDQWQHPVILMFREPGRRPPRHPIVVSVHEGDADTQKIQIDIHDPALADSPQLENAIWQALLLEYAWRDQPLRAGRAFRLAPEWLIEGLAEERRRTGLQGRVLEGLLAGGHQPAIQELFRNRPPPPAGTERAIFRTLSQALVRTLGDLPEGQDRLLAVVRRLREEPIRQETLLEEYPSLEGSMEHLERLWILTLARFSASARAESLTLRETTAALHELMNLSAPFDPEADEVQMVRGPVALPFIARAEDGPTTLTRLNESLVELEMRAHPLYRPVIAEYRDIVSRLLRRPNSRVQTRIERNDALSAALMERSTEIDDYLNWYELHNIAAPDPEFLKILQSQSQFLDSMERTDTISRHLDAIEQRYR